MNENNVYPLSWVKWSVSEARYFQEVLDNGQMGELFYAVMLYAGTGEQVEVSPGVRLAFNIFCEKVDNFRKAYAKECEKNARNGAKGGRPKKDAKAKEPDGPTFTPPTKTEFRNMAKHYKSEAVFDAYELDQFYDELVSINWTIGAVKIESTEALDAAFFARFHYHNPWKNTTTWLYFKNVFQLSGGDLDIWNRFEDCYNEAQRHWTVNGTTYDNPADAVRAILEST